MADAKFNRIDKALETYGVLLKSKYKDKLLADKTYASGRTSDSIKHTVSNQSLTMSYDKTLEAIDSGTSNYSRMPDPRRIMEWMNVKGIQGRNQKTGRFIKQDRAAFAIAKYIERNGTVKRFSGGTSILSIVYNEIADKLGQDILEAWRLDVMDNLDNSLPNAKK